MRRETLLTLAAAVAAGFIGGFLAVRTAAPGAALAASDGGRRPQPQERVVTAERFVLVDGAGNPKAALEVNRDREAGLFLYDAGRVPAAGFFADNDGVPAIELYDERGGRNYRIAARDPGRGGTSALVVAGKEARLRMILSPGRKDEKTGLQLEQRGSERNLWTAP